MTANIYKNALRVLAKMPFKLWGLSLLYSLLCVLILIFGWFPIITIPVSAVLSVGMASVYLDGYRGREVNSDQLFSGFKDFWRTAGGMCWKKLWILLWTLIPIAGPFIAIVKEYSYSFTPYVLSEDKSVTATEALRKSIKSTNGYKVKMFCALFLPQLIISIGMLLLSVLSQIPIIGILFSLALAIVVIVYALFGPLFFGLVQAGFYDVITMVTPQVEYTHTENQDEKDAASVICPICEAANRSGAGFCYKCGSKLE